MLPIHVMQHLIFRNAVHPSLFCIVLLANYIYNYRSWFLILPHPEVNYLCSEFSESRAPPAPVAVVDNVGCVGNEWSVMSDELA